MAFRVVVYPVQYGPAKGTLAGYYFNGDISASAPAAEEPPGQSSIFVIPYADAKFPAIARHILWRTNDDTAAAEAAAEPETTQDWRARLFRPQWNLLAARALLYGAIAEVEEAAAAEAETNPTTLARHQPVRHRVIPSLLFGGDMSESGPVTVSDPETNPAWLGRYQATRHRIVRSLLFGQDTSQSAPVSEGPLSDQPSIFVVGYGEPKPPAITRYLYFGGDMSESAPVQPAEESVHQTQWRRQVVKSEWITPTYGLSKLNELEIPAAPFAEQPDTTQIQRLRHQPTRHVVARHLLFQSDLSSSAESIADNPSNFFPIVYTDNWYGRRPPLVPDMSESAPFVEPEAETNPNTIGRYRPAQYSIWPGLRFEPDTSQSGPQPEPETNPPFIGRHHAGHHTLWPGLRFGQDTSQSAPVPEPETNPNFLARYHRGTHRVIPGLLYGWPDTSQSGPTTPETNPHFVGRYHPAHHLVAAGLLYWQPNPSESAPTVPPPVPGGRRHLPLWMRRLELELIR